MTIRMKVVNGTLVVRPFGSLTEQSAHELQVQVEKELDPAPLDVVLSMEGVESMAVGSLPYLFRIQKRARADNCRFYVASAPAAALRLFELTRVSSKLDLVPSEEEALRSTVS